MKTSKKTAQESVKSSKSAFETEADSSKYRQRRPRPANPANEMTPLSIDSMPTSLVSCDREINLEAQKAHQPKRIRHSG